MENQKETTTEVALETIVTNAVKIPLVKVDRNGFLASTFANEDISIETILDLGPIQAGITREKLANLAEKLILKRTGQSSAASFVAGIPGGLAMAAIIPADVLQFFGMALRLAQELSYLYGAENLWKDGQVDDEKIRSQLILYCGVMFGISGAVSGVRLLSVQMAKVALKKLPQKALTKTFWYPILKQIGKAIGVKITKSTVAKGVSKAVPILGGVVSGRLNFAFMMPMGKRLYKALDKANFDYSDEEMEADIEVLENLENDPASQEQPAPKNSYSAKETAKQKFSHGIYAAKMGLSRFAPKKNPEKEPSAPSADDILSNLEKLSKLRDAGVITQDDFNAKKDELLAKI